MSYMSTKQLLIDAKALVNEKGWTQGWLAVDAKGKTTGVMNPKACAFCAFGAVVRAGGNDNNVWMNAYNILTSLTNGIGPWNDEPGRTLDDVNALFDRAIEIAEY